ncbi:DUF3613 domain-containing protein [Dyella amyloliquefaciens]|uniref:DUF3613 domain-containing protein n=1 Tax=Dyella amyloliquefaciens TaxID=1770545 RepID=UPI00102EA269|nr:DUF3613 domain-containing protein [Dyella amyloliquefaciens]
MSQTLRILSRRGVFAAFAALLALPAAAQQSPITGRMLDAAPAPAAAQEPSVPATPAAPTDTDSADRSVTRQLLRMQAEGQHAGKALPITGAEASASYSRYLKSFEHPIPAFYTTNVSGNKNASGTAGAQ